MESLTEGHARHRYVGLVFAVKSATKPGYFGFDLSDEKEVRSGMSWLSALLPRRTASSDHLPRFKKIQRLMALASNIS